MYICSLLDSSRTIRRNALILGLLLFYCCGVPQTSSKGQEEVQHPQNSSPQLDVQHTPDDRAQQNDLYDAWGDGSQTNNAMNCSKEVACLDDTIAKDQKVIREYVKKILNKSLVVSHTDKNSPFPSKVMFEHLGTEPICFVNAFIGSAPSYYFTSIANHLLFSSLHGYTYRSYMTNSLNPEFWEKEFPQARSSNQAWVFWEKFFAVQSMFDLRSPTDSNYLCEWVVWIDADTIFTNLNQSLQARLAEYIPFDLFNSVGSAEVDEPINGVFSREMVRPHIPINAGIFMLRRSDWTDKLIQQMLLGYPAFKDEVLREQTQLMQFILPTTSEDGMRSVLQKDWAKHVYIIPQRAINSRYIVPETETYPLPYENFIWREGDFLIHYAGRSGETRYLEMIKRLKQMDFAGFAEQFVPSTSMHVYPEYFFQTDLALLLRGLLYYK